MGHEIFFKIFEGPQIFLLFSIFIILFFKFKGLEHKISIKEILKRQDMLNKSHPLSRFKANSGKNKKMLDAF